MMFALIVGGGKVGTSLTRTLVSRGKEVVLIEQRPDRYERLSDEFGHLVQLGDATELHVLERAGIQRPPSIVVATTGDDEDNLVICQLARETYGVEKVIARVNDPRNQRHFDLMAIAPTVSATQSILALIEHEVPEHELVHLLQLRKENLEIVEVVLTSGAPAVGCKVGDLDFPEEIKLVSVVRDGNARIAVADTELQVDDQVIAVLEPGREQELREKLLCQKK